MNANFGILPELEGKKIKDKKEIYETGRKKLTKFLNGKILQKCYN